jgi:predicted nucleic acid-binding Zn ribbon protein
MDDAQLQTVWQQRQFKHRISHVSEPLSMLVRHRLARRAKQVGQLATIWDDVVPDAIRDHTALESFNRGVLTVMVDSAPHRFQLQTLLSGGLLREIRDRFSGPLNRVKLVPGQFCSVDVAGMPRYEF